MKINSLLESQTVSSAISNTTTSAPVFGRDEDRLEETTTSGCVSSDASPVGKVRSRGSIFSGINTSEKFPNSKAVKEENLPVFDKKQKYIQAAKDVLKGADFDHVARVRKLDVEMLRKFVGFAHEKLSKGEYKLNRPNLEEQGVAEGVQQLSVQQLATISDEALDKAYGYGRSTPGNSFGWQANLKSASYAKQMIDKGITDIEAISDAIHKGWNVTAKAFVQNPEQFDDTAKLKAAGKLEAKLQQRAQLMKQNYAQLPEDEKEKDRVVARALLQAIKGQQGVAEGLNEFAPAGGGGNIPRGPKTPKRGPWDDSGEDPYQLRRYNRSIDFFDQFDSDGVDKQKFDKATGEYEGYYFDRDAASGITQIAYFKFDDPTKIGDDDPGVGWYYEPIDEGVAEGNDPFKPEPHDEFASDTYYDNKPGHDTAEDYRAKAQWLMRTHHLRPDEAMEYAYYDTDPATWKGSPWENDYKQGVEEAGQNFRRGNARRAALNAMSPEELKAYEEKRAEQQRKRDEARLERDRQRTAAKKGMAEATGTLARARDRLGLNAVPLQRSTDNWNDERDARHQSRLSDIERRTRYQDELSNISLDRERHRLARMQKDDDEWNDTFNAMRDRIRHRSNYQFGRENDPRLEQGVAEGYEDEDCHVCGGTGEGRTEYDTCYNCKGSGVEPHGHDDDDFDIPDDDYDDFGDDESYYEKSIRTRNLDEAEISEEMLAHELYKDLQIFKHGKDKTIGKKSKSKDISKKPEDRDIVVKEGTDMKASEILNEGKPGLWANIHAKRERIKHGSGERMRKPGSKGAPSAQDFKDAAKTEAANPAQQAAIAIAMKKKGQKPKNEGVDDREYNDEAGMFKNDLQTIQRVSNHLEKAIQDNENLPEWCQAKIAQAKGMVVNVMDYMISQHENGIVDTLEEEFDLIESIVEGIAVRNNVNSEAIWEDLESLTDDELYVFAVTSEPINEDWQKVNKKDKTDGMSPKAVKAYRRENPGSKLKTAVTTKPSKLKKGSKASKRRKSYCSRSRGQMKMHNISCSKTPDKAICKARRRWNC